MVGESILGRYATAEFEERLSEAVAAKTRGDLAALVADLPELDIAVMRSRRVLPMVGILAGFLLGAAFISFTVYSAVTTSYFAPVSLSPTATTISSSSNPSTYGQSVTFTAVVSPAIPLRAVSGAVVGRPGTVAFTADGATIRGCGSQRLRPSLANDAPRTSATCTTKSLSLGEHAIVATYSGNTNFSSSSGELAIKTLRAKPKASDRL